MTLWIGERLGAVERACLRSVLRQGHPLALYCYEPPKGLPAGVELRDANDVIPADQVFRHRRRGSFAPFSDWFRYELQARGAGTWLDADVYLLAPIDGQAAYLFGEESPGIINNSVLRLPAQSEAVRQLLEPIRTNSVPPWASAGHRWWSRLRGKGWQADRRNWPWSMHGPLALTAVARNLGLMREAQPPEVFYPVSWARAAWIQDPDCRLEYMIKDQTVAVHLWNECIKDFKDEPAPKGSFLERLQEEGAE